MCDTLSNKVKNFSLFHFKVLIMSSSSHFNCSSTDESIYCSMSYQNYLEIAIVYFVLVTIPVIIFIGGILVMQQQANTGQQQMMRQQKKSSRRRKKRISSKNKQRR